MTDPITDMFNRIKNSLAVFQTSVDVPYSEIKFGIAEILKKESFLSDCKKRGTKASKIIRITLNYEDKVPVLSGFKRISKPGQRVYRKFNEVKRVKNGYGIAIISTPMGLLTDREAKREKVGGEVLVEAW